MKRAVCPAVVLVVLLGGSSAAAAQERSTYVGGAFMVQPFAANNVDGGSASSTYSNAATETHLVGVVAEVGAFFSRRGSIGVEIGLPFHRNEIAQQYGYRPYERISRYREETVFVVLRGQVADERRVGVTVVGGGGWVLGSSLDRYARYPPGSNVPGPFEPEREESHVALGLTFGADLAVKATPRVSIVPQFRLLVTPRGDPKELNFANLGLRALAYRIGVGIQATF